MKDFNELTSGGKKRRYRKVAEIALAKYAIDAVGMDFLTEATNTFYKVTDSQDEKFALKIFQEESSALSDNLAEMYFLRQVRKLTDIKAPMPISSESGDDIIHVASKYTPEVKRIAMYSWLEGRALNGIETEKRFYRVGQLAAKLHDATVKLTVPENLSPKKWDKVFYYNGEVPVYKGEKFQSFLTKEYHETMDFIIPYLNEKLSKFYESGQPQLIHADLNPWNIRLHNGDMRLLDFEEAMLGYPVHDIAIMLFYYRYDRTFGYEKVKELLLNGYSSIRTLPAVSDFDIELLITARRVNFLNYILLLYDKPTDYLKVNTGRVREFISKHI